MVSAQLPEGDGSCCGDIEGVNPALHGDDGLIVACVDGALLEAVAFSAENDDEAFFSQEGWVVDGNGLGREGEGNGFKAFGAKLEQSWIVPRGDVCPRNLEDGAHADTDTTTVERVAASGGKKYASHAQGGCSAEDGTRVGTVYHAVNKDDATLAGAYLLDGRKNGAPHGTEYPASEFVTGEGCQKLTAADKDRNPIHTGNDIGCLPSDMLFFAEERKRLVAGVEGDANHFRAFGDEDALLRFEPVAKLCLGKTGVGLQPRMREVGDGNKHFGVMIKG